MMLGKQNVVADAREKPSLQECAVGDYCLAGGDAFRLAAHEQELRIPMLEFVPVGDKCVSVRTGVTMEFSLRWTSDDLALYCWLRVA